MRRKDREVTEMEEIQQILMNARCAESGSWMRTGRILCR